MGLGKFGIILAENISRYVKATGKRSILETKSIAANNIKDKSFVYKSKYDFELNKMFSYIRTNSESCVPSDFIKQYCKRELYKEQKTWGRILHHGEEKQAIFNYAEQTSNNCKEPLIMAMSITSKQRMINNAKIDVNIAERMKKFPEHFKLSEDESLAKRLLDETFKTIKPNEFDSITYRGALLKPDSPFYKKLSSLKNGELYTEPGYIWTTPSPEYAFGRYADRNLLGLKRSIKYTILNPAGTVERRMQGHSRENLMKFNSKFKVHNVIKDSLGNLELFIENVP